MSRRLEQKKQCRKGGPKALQKGLLFRPEICKNAFLWDLEPSWGLDGGPDSQNHQNYLQNNQKSAYCLSKLFTLRDAADPGFKVIRPKGHKPRNLKNRYSACKNRSKKHRNTRRNAAQIFVLNLVVRAGPQSRAREESRRPK